jgi:hydrogenase maturation protease
MNTAPRILVAGIGNIFLGDDAFGVHVAQRLLQRDWPENIRVRDFGIRGLDLVYALVDGCDTAILIDAVPRGQMPGTLYVIEPDLSAPAANVAMEAHSMDPVKVLNSARSLGAKIGRVLIVGCEPTPLDPSPDMQMNLSPAVAAAIEPAARRVESLIDEISAQPFQLGQTEVSDAHESFESNARRGA